MRALENEMLRIFKISGENTNSVMSGLSGKGQSVFVKTVVACLQNMYLLRG